MMREKRSPFDARFVNYLRPDQPYQCGNRDGQCCAGPSPSGRCPDAESPCIPVPSEGKTRQKYFRRAVLLTCGLVMMAISGNDESLVDPGSLSSFHAHLSCADCHQPVEMASMEFVRRGVMGQGDPHASMKCLECHDLGEFGGDPHSVSPDHLKSLFNGSPATATPVQDVACARCHGEHHPSDPVTQVSDSSCQSCHQQRFASLSDGHPEFSSSFGQPERAIIFDHADHAKKHFDEFPDLAPASCNGCHDLGPDQQRMIVKPFEVSCAPCHADSISGHEATGKQKGIEVLSIPALDTGSLLEAEKDIGSWPYGGSEFPTAWSLRWIRSSGIDNSKLEQLSAVELYSLEDQSDEVLSAAQQLARHFKEGVADALSSDLELFTRSLVAPSVRDGLDRSQIAQLSGQLPRSVLMKASSDWFAPQEQDDRSDSAEDQESTQEEAGEDDLLLDDSEDEEDDLLLDDSEDEEDDLLLDDSGDEEDDLLLDDSEDEDLSTDEPDTSMKNVDVEKWATAGGWYFEEPSIRYRPVQHADPFIEAWATIEARYGGSDPDSESVFEQVFGPLAAGNCASCHLGVKYGNPRVHWSPESMRSVSSPQSTRFSHRPHVLQGSSMNCLDCHQFANDPQHSNDWKAITRDRCTDCHGQEIDSSCSTCHDYHVGLRNDPLNAVSIDHLQLHQKK